MTEADTIERLAEIETGDQITFGDRKQPLTVNSHRREVREDGLDSFECVVEGNRGGKYKLRLQDGWRSTHIQKYRLQENILEDEWQKNGRVDVDSIQLVEKGDFEHSEVEQELLSYDLGETIYLDLGGEKMVEAVANRFQIRNDRVTLNALDVDQNPDVPYRKSYSIQSPDLLNDQIHGNFHPDDLTADLVKYDQITVSATPFTTDEADQETGTDGSGCELCEPILGAQRVSKGARRDVPESCGCSEETGADDDPEVMTDGGTRRVPEKGERVVMRYYSERAGRVKISEGEVDHASEVSSRVYDDDEEPEAGNGHMEDGIHGYVIEDSSGRKLSFNTASMRAGSFGEEQFTHLGDLVSIDFSGDAADPEYLDELAGGE